LRSAATHESVAQLQGSMSQRCVADPGAFERAHYIRTVGTHQQQTWSSLLA
jgi:hypothetical protein